MRLTIQSNLSILSFDTTGSKCSLAFEDPSIEIQDSFSSTLISNHASLLIPRITELLTQAGKQYKDLDLLCVVRGPGSFTGIRVGLAAAMGYKIALEIPTFSPTLLEVWAYMAATYTPHLKKKIVVAKDTLKEGAFCQLFAPDLTPLKEAESLEWEEAKALVQSHDALFVSDNLQGTEGIEPRETAAKAALAYCKYILEQGRLNEYKSLDPFYIIEPEFKKKDAVLTS